MSKKKKSKNISLEEILKDENYKVGIFRRKEKGFGFVNIGEDDKEIFISPNNTNKALDSDKVLIKILENGISINPKHNKEGKIIKILEHKNDKIVGTFKKSKNFGFVIPDDQNLSEDIYIPKRKASGIKNNQKVVVKIEKYAIGKNKAEGSIIEVLGNINEAGVDMLALIKEYNLPNEFPQSVIDDIKEIPEQITENSIKNRVDLRNEEIFTIDGEDAKDLDDAVNVEKNEDGTYTLGVHIADVSYYVKSGSKIDKEAIKRGTSIYMMNRVIPMLPKELSNGICSLNENQDRFTISVIMKIDKRGIVIESDIFKSVIKTTKRMNYHDVDNIFKYEDLKKSIISSQKFSDGELLQIKKSAEEYKEYINHFLIMRELKDILKNRRDRNGSLNLDIPESKIILDENGIAIDVKKYDYLESNEVIEQFMLTANETVAEKFYWMEAPFIYRVHEVPDLDKIDELNKFLFNLGYKIKGIKKNDKESIHPKAFSQVLEAVKGKPEERIVSNLILRTLKVARYESENKGHFGIASKCYCHFTSPIRRYPDLFIHRVISSYLKHDYTINEELKAKYKKEAVEYSESSSEREKIAQKVERDAESIKKAEFMHGKIGEIYKGIISNITQFGMFVELDNTIEGLVRFEDIGNEYFSYDEERKILVGENSRTIYKIGQEVTIKVKNADKLTKKIDFELIIDNKNK